MRPTSLVANPDCSICGGSLYSLGHLCTCAREEPSEAGWRRSTNLAEDWSLLRLEEIKEATMAIPENQLEFVGHGAYFNMCEDAQLLVDEFGEKGWRGWLMSGKPGCGKTTMALSIIAEIRRGEGGRNKTIRLLNVPEWIGRIKATFDDKRSIQSEEVAEAADCGILLLDDLGAEKASDWTRELMYSVLDARSSRRAPTLVTTNMKPKALEKHVGERIYSRLAEILTWRLFPEIDLRAAKVSAVA